MRVPKRLAGACPSKARSPIQERETARRLGGIVTKASGGGAFEKGDVRIYGLARLELKTTRHRSFSVSVDMVDKIEGHALQAGEIPVIEIELDSGATKVAVIPSWALDVLLQRGAR